jgi:hypothetical protein
LLEQVGGWDSFASRVASMIRQAIDEVIDTPRTNRFTLSETEKTEKTYLGTKIEILFRALLGLPKGRILDLSVRGAEVDIKNTIGSAWAIPMEAVGRPCILIQENEQTALCSVGIFIAHEKYLRPGKNRDRKSSIASSAMRAHVWWLLRDFPYPGNVWESMPLNVRENIMSAGSAMHRLAALFKSIQERPISRGIVQAVAQQDDYTKRLRRNGGARDLLAPQGIAILWGQKDRLLIRQLGLGPLENDQFISYRATTAVVEQLLRNSGHID